MTSKTHVALGLLIGLATIKYNPSADIYIAVSGACIGSLLPDLDTKKSDPSQIFPPISAVVDKITKHRGATHTMFPLILIICYLYFAYFPAFMLGIGSLSHTVLDAVTLKLGIKCTSVKERTGEEYIYYVLWVLNVVMVVNMVAGYYNL